MLEGVGGLLWGSTSIQGQGEGVSGLILVYGLGFRGSRKLKSTPTVDFDLEPKHLAHSYNNRS